MSPVLKARLPGDTWATLGGVGIGLIPGGTTGQVLTKKSAADYDTQWSTNPPILANNTYLQGYRADGTTVQDLIGILSNNAVVIAASPPGALSIGYAAGDIQIGPNGLGDIQIGPSLAAGKQIYVPRLWVQGGLIISSGNWLQDELGKLIAAGSPNGNIYFANNSTTIFNASGGYTTFEQDLQVRGILYKAGVGAYTFPDFVFEHHFTGGIERFRDAPGADTYEGLWPLARVEEFAQEHWRLPGHAARENDRVDMFRRTHDLLAELERVYLHLFEHERRLSELEER